MRLLITRNGRDYATRKGKCLWSGKSISEEKLTMATFIGIDLGTTFSAIAQIDETGRPVIGSNRDG